MADAEITTTILRQIRDEIAATRTDLKATRIELKAELAATRIELTEEVSATRAELKAEISITNEGISLVEHSVRDLAQQVVMLTRYVKNTNDDLKKRVTRLEKKSS